MIYYDDNCVVKYNNNVRWDSTLPSEKVEAQVVYVTFSRSHH